MSSEIEAGDHEGDVSEIERVSSQIDIRVHSGMADANDSSHNKENDNEDGNIKILIQRTISNSFQQGISNVEGTLNHNQEDFLKQRVENKFLELGIPIDNEIRDKITHALAREQQTEIPVQVQCESIVNYIVQSHFDQPMKRSHSSENQEIPLGTPSLKKVSSVSTFSNKLFETPLQEQIDAIYDHELETPDNKEANIIIQDGNTNDPCPICYNTLSPSTTVDSECGHKTCKTCFVSYIQELINSNKLLNIQCPIDGCIFIWDDNFIQRFYPAQDYDRYLRFRKLALINSDPSLRWCIRYGCGKFVKGSEDNPRIVCECGTEMCFKCGLSWHNRTTCQKAMELEYKVLADDRQFQNCPKCRSICEKESGCNHMTCSICSYQWCWLCRGKYSSGHYASMNPFGCSGLQDGMNTKKDWSRARIFLKRLGLILLWILIFFAVPYVLLGILICWPLIIYIYLARRSPTSHSKPWYVKVLLLSGCLIVSVITAPFILLIVSYLFLPILGAAIGALCLKKIIWPCIMRWILSIRFRLAERRIAEVVRESREVVSANNR